MIVALAPLVAGIALLRLLPSAALQTEPPTGTWRVDPLALVGCSVVALAAVRPRSALLTLRTSLAAACVMLALLANVPVLHLLALVVASLLVFDGLTPRWFIALALHSVVTLGPAWLPLTPATTLHLTLLAAFVGIGGLPTFGRRAARAEVVLRPFWIVATLRTLMLEPWPVATMVLATTAGVITLALVAYTLLRSAPALDHERMSALLLIMALVAAAQNTTLGVVAALWALAMVAALVAMSRADAPPSFTLACVTLGTAAWWTAGAVAAAGGFLAASVVCIAAVMVCVAAALTSGRSSRAGRFGVSLLLLALLVGTPWTASTFGLPVADQLGAGLTALGLVDAWGFIGTSALDAGHRRVTLLPSIVLGSLLAVLWAALWLMARIGGRISPAPRTSSNASAPPLDRARVWWLR
jgi:hypothetical protein